MADQQVETFLKLNSGFEQMSLTIISDALHPDVVHVTRPQSINMPERNKAQTLEHYETMFSNWVAVENVTYAILANAPGKIVTHINCDITLKSGPIVHYESFISLGIDEDPSGDRKVKYIEEFIDTNVFSQGFAPHTAAKA